MLSFITWSLLAYLLGYMQYHILFTCGSPALSLVRSGIYCLLLSFRKCPTFFSCPPVPVETGQNQCNILYAIMIVCLNLYYSCWFVWLCWISANISDCSIVFFCLQGSNVPRFCTDSQIYAHTVPCFSCWLIQIIYSQMQKYWDRDTIFVVLSMCSCILDLK